MSARVVLDTSVVFKWFVGYGETGLDGAWELLNGHRDGHVTLIAPSLLHAEVANRLRFSGVNPDDAAALLAEFDACHIVCFDETPERTMAALRCAFDNRVTVYDALFLSLAQEFECELATADRKAFGAVPPATAAVRLIL